ncbi:hypothetical protein SAMD00023353_0802000 [Rosellinia necatrix]|uniref:Uncharacterized protein n=1 Tax=Rosellinia necatrix TaxID=77044 RepID=A0A1W2TB72_ROSNE|nr:hypothetical protein SAMD00023353_0802000 [Rosellinia necatrix]
MVVRTPALGSMRRGLLHQPLPLNRRESQQLLESITSSFRKNLDQEHPWGADETSTDTSASSTSDSAEPPCEPPCELRCGFPPRPVDRHLRAILTNPLFAQPRDDTSTPAIRNKAYGVFDMAVARGLMTPRRAVGFLATVRSQLVAESPDNIRRRMGASGAGLRVLQWLRASGLEKDLNFLGNHPFVKLMVAFLYAEGLQDVAWGWLAQLAARAAELEFENNPDKANAMTLSKLTSAIIRENSESDSSPVSLDGSFVALERASSMLPRENRVGRAAVKNAWAGLSWASTVNALERPKPSVQRFERFVDIGRPLNLPLDLAHLDLHHPTTPTHSAAVEYLRLRQEIANDISDMKPHIRQRVLCLVLDAAEKLTRTRQSAEAPWVERMRIAICEKLNLDILNIRIEDSLNSVTPLRKSL